MQKLAWFFSILLHPLVVLNIGLILILFYHPYFNSKYYDEQLSTFIYYILANTFFIPILGILLLKQFKVIDNFQLANHKQRTIPYILIAVILSFTIFQLLKYEFKGLPIYFLLSTIICLILNIIINFKFGISSHAIAAGGFVALVFYISIVQHVSTYAYILPIGILLAGVSGFSRLWLGAHTPKQIYWGYALGFVIVFSGVFLLEKWSVLI